ncbi:hypothetical protein [Streptomyces sp. CRN 30]|uniref:hypothetical protein n=1 Tax=Streptomyces sp. CRN 30 TaxID=3075613 RepID=UPI002A819C4B|nr:hypothetical protein [Streptomyces sp. CRN 30]
MRHAPLAAVMTDFLGRLRDESREIPYPAQALRRAYEGPGRRAAARLCEPAAD